MGEQDLVESGGEPSEESSAALADTETTQEQSGASSADGGTPASDDSQAQPTVEELQRQRDEDRSELERTREFARQQQAEARRLGAELAPIREKQRKEREEQLSQDEWFNKRAEQVGTVQALREVNEAVYAEQREKDQATFQQNTFQAQFEKAAGEAADYAKDRGLSQDDWELLTMKHNGFNSNDPAKSLRLAKKAIDREAKELGVKVGNDALVKNAEKEVRRKVAGQAAGGAGATAAGEPELKDTGFLGGVTRAAQDRERRAALLE